MQSGDLNPGSTAEVFIKAPYAGTGLITIERDHVYTYKWFKTNKLSTVQKITIPENLEGNGYINVMFTRDIASDEIFMSPFCYGAIPFSVGRARRTNKIKLNVPQEIKSGTDLNIEYSSSDSGRIVIMAVDEGILQVARYETPDPLAQFFKKRALEVRTSQILDLILPEFNVLKTLGATGGGADMKMLEKNLNPFKRKQNASVVFWSGIVETGPEKRTVKYSVPDYFNGNIRVMAVAVSKDKMGVAQTSTLAKNTFIISPNVPLAVAPGDEFDISVTVTNNHKGSGSDKISLKAVPSEHLKIEGEQVVSLTINEGKDSTANFKVRAKEARVYLVKDDQGNVSQVVLPMYGRGLWSTMYGFVAVAPDANTIKGITYYDQGETAGLGGEIANPRWQALFVDKKLFDDNQRVAIRVAKNASSNKEHGVDALSGATLTSNGVQGSFDYWFSQNGFGPFLAKFKAGAR